jgi:hypothetical protein
MPLSVFENRVNRPCGPFEDAVFGSRMLKQYAGLLAKCGTTEILDLGPVCGSNIAFFLGHTAKLHVYDVLARFPSERLRQEPMEKILATFLYEKNSLDGIHIWDLPDHLDNKALSLMVQKLGSLLKPRGLLVMIACNLSGHQSFSQYFKIGDNCTVSLQKAMARRLPYFYRTNRDIERAMKPFEQLSSYICTNGMREFLFRHCI